MAAQGKTASKRRPHVLVGHVRTESVALVRQGKASKVVVTDVNSTPLGYSLAFLSLARQLQNDQDFGLTIVPTNQLKRALKISRLCAIEELVEVPPDMHKPAYEQASNKLRAALAGSARGRDYGRAFCRSSR